MIKVLKEFTSKGTTKRYVVGESIDLGKDRNQELVGKGVAEFVEQPKEDKRRKIKSEKK